MRQAILCKNYEADDSATITEKSFEKLFKNLQNLHILKPVQFTGWFYIKGVWFKVQGSVVSEFTAELEIILSKGYSLLIWKGSKAQISLALHDNRNANNFAHKAIPCGLEEYFSVYFPKALEFIQSTNHFDKYLFGGTNMHRVHKFSGEAVDEILAKVGSEPTLTLKTNGKTYELNLDSDRLRTFKKSKTCVCCGLVGEVFCAEAHTTKETPHLNLYGLDEFGSLVLMTKDHIIPKSKGGKNYIDNYQTMCVNCNMKKGDKI